MNNGHFVNQMLTVKWFMSGSFRVVASAENLGVLGGLAVSFLNRPG